jgi:hypothetical protein
MKNAFLSIATFAFLATTAQAATLAEKKQLEKWNAYLTDADSSYVKTVQDKCGVAIAVKLDDAFVTSAFMKESVNAAAFCDSAREGVATLCGDATSKSEVVKRVKSISCHPSKTAEELTFKLNGSTLDLTVGTQGANIADKAKEFLENNL